MVFSIWNFVRRLFLDTVVNALPQWSSAKVLCKHKIASNRELMVPNSLVTVNSGNYPQGFCHNGEWFVMGIGLGSCFHHKQNWLAFQHVPP